MASLEGKKGCVKHGTAMGSYRQRRKGLEQGSQTAGAQVTVQKHGANTRSEAGRSYRGVEAARIGAGNKNEGDKEKDLLSIKLFSLVGTNSGFLLNLVTNDSQKLLDAATNFHFVWFMVIEIGVISTLAIIEIGVSAVPGVILAFFTQPLQVWMAHLGARLRIKAIKYTDSRVHLTGEVLNGIRVIKYNGWIALFLRRIQELRHLEINGIKRASLVRAATSTIRVSRDFPEKAVVLKNCSFCWVSRQKKVVSNERSGNVHIDIGKESGTDAHDIWLDVFSFGHNQSKADVVLRNINFSVATGELVSIFGPVGSGKSSLLLGILGEMQCLRGTKFVRHNIAYVPQQPWILNDTIRQNIVFTSPFDPERYQSTIAACALEHDISLFAGGHDTEIGDKGINLSGGQKARISLARACYSTAPIVFLDDPLAAVDVATAKHLIKHVLEGVLKRRTIVLVTHNKTALHICDQVYFMEKGSLREGEKLKRVNSSTYTSNLGEQTEVDALMHVGVSENSKTAEKNPINMPKSFSLMHSKEKGRSTVNEDRVIGSVQASIQLFEFIISSFGSLIFLGVLIPWFLLAFPPFLFVFFYLQRRYVVISRELRRLEGISRSPIYAHFTQTLQGIISVRAYGTQTKMHKIFTSLIDANHRSYIMFVHVSRWMGIRLDFATCLCVTLASLLVVLLRHSITPGLAGVVIVQGMQVTGYIQLAVRQAAEVENYLTSVERINAYTNLATEADPNTAPGVIEKDWPSRGEVEFVKYTMTYRVDLTPILNEVSFKIHGKEKIGILGRTGVGKSSLAAALFRMVENERCGGNIFIDGINIKFVGLDDLRQRLSIIPQDPILIQESVRFNLDPFEVYTDVEIYEALERVHLLPTIQGLDGGLDSLIAQNGENFSVGQRQLICLARSLLRRSQIIVMDEATAAVDGETDTLIQRTIKTTFQQCTLLTIAHRIDTVIDCDRVLILASGGHIAEFDSPHKLLNCNKQG
ncbi:hypothetical protein L7F22_068989 [Adiantum nelumboides]|nr:hypothetical protein [Adiantum nelumboides]